MVVHGDFEIVVEIKRSLIYLFNFVYWAANFSGRYFVFIGLLLCFISMILNFLQNFYKKILTVEYLILACDFVRQFCLTSSLVGLIFKHEKSA